MILIAHIRSLSTPGCSIDNGCNGYFISTRSLRGEWDFVFSSVRTLAFLSARRDSNDAAPAKAQVYALAMGGGEGRALTSLRNGVTAFQWSPNGSRLACVSRIGTSDSLPPGKELGPSIPHQDCYNHPIKLSGLRKLVRRGVSEELAAKTAGSRLGPWHVSQSPALDIALSNAALTSLGLPSLVEGR